MDISFWVAFSAGLLSFFSPCILPIIPGFLSYIGGLSADEFESGQGKRKLITETVAFVFGFSMIFVLLGYSASALGGFLFDNRDIIRGISGILLIIMGIALMDIPFFQRLYIGGGFNERRIALPFLGSFVIGLGFALGWSPCLGPVLVGILSVAASGESSYQGALLLGAFAAGMGIPFIAASFLVRGFLSLWDKVQGVLIWVKRLSSAALILLGAYTIWDIF